jgi:hypothetical protein
MVNLQPSPAFQNSAWNTVVVFLHLDDSNRMMRIQHKIVLLLTMMLISACGTESSPPIEPHVPVMATQAQENKDPIVETSVPADTLITIASATSPSETTAPNCLGDEISPIGQSIAEDYGSASYEQVITWFCDGAEFEDILVALETETLVDTPAEEMLQMLADGFTWDEIWLFVGLTD